MENLFKDFATLQAVTPLFSNMSKESFIACMCMLFEEWAAEHDDDPADVALDAVAMIKLVTQEVGKYKKAE